MNKKIIVFIVLALLVLPASSLFAGSLKGVSMPDAIEVEGQKLVLNGMALRKKVIFKVYVAGLYLLQKETNGEKILESDTMRRTVMHFVRSVGAGKINDGWIDGLKANTPNASAELKKQFDTLCSLMEDVEDKDQIVFTYIPAKGTEVKVKGKIKGTLEGKPFADALYSCWIGPKPGPGESFKEDLLGIE